jgi:hypothetical protein
MSLRSAYQITFPFSPITALSPFDALTLAQGGPLTSLSDIALATSDHGRASGLAVRLQDLFLILSQCVDLGLFPVAAAFSAARHLQKILRSGFEMIRIRVSQCESPRVFPSL